MVRNIYHCILCETRVNCKSHYIRHCSFIKHKKNRDLFKKLGLKKWFESKELTRYDTTYGVHKVYKITNSIDDKIYIGSTKARLSHRMATHRSNNDCIELKTHIKKIGIQHFKIETIRHFKNDKLLARQTEQDEINKIPTELLLNSTRAYSHNHNATRNQELVKIKNKRWRDKRKLNIQSHNNDKLKCKKKMRQRRLLKKLNIKPNIISWNEFQSNHKRDPRDVSKKYEEYKQTAIDKILKEQGAVVETERQLAQA